MRLEDVKKCLEKEILLFDGGAPGTEDTALKETIWEEDWEQGKTKVLVSDVVHPSILPFLPCRQEHPMPAILVIPGGGYVRQVMNLEGTEIARWLNSLGIAAFVLKYRLPQEVHRNPLDAPLADAQRAVRQIRHRAKEWNIDPGRVGVMGFSAGGHVAATLSTCFFYQMYQETDAADQESARPDFTVMAYPAISYEMEREACMRGYREQSFPNAFCSRDQMLAKYSVPLLVTPDTPPAFLVETDDDKLTLSEGSIAYYQALRKFRIPAELHILQTGDHGFGLGDTRPQTGQWKEFFVNWAKTMKVL